MSNGSIGKQVWFMRHGKTTFDYDNCTYEQLIEALCNGNDIPLADDHQIDVESLPQSVELVCCSPARRAVETANKLQKHVNVGAMEKMDVLREVKFDRNIIRKKEYTSLKNSLPHILTHWFKSENKPESFQQSMERVRRIDEFLHSRQEVSIVFITHGLFLRPLDLYFAQCKGNHITLKDLLNVEPIKLGQFVNAPLDGR
jgi:broad specificity phosphatase PhoE